MDADSVLKNKKEACHANSGAMDIWPPSANL